MDRRHALSLVVGAGVSSLGSAPARAADTPVIEWNSHMFSANTVKFLAVGSEKRNAALPNVPAMSEILPGFVSMSWQGLVAPPGTPAAIASRVSVATAEAIRQHAALLTASAPELPPVTGRAEVLGRLKTLRLAFPDGALAGQRLLLAGDEAGTGVAAFEQCFR